MTNNANESDQLLQKNVGAKIGFILTEQSTEGKNIKNKKGDEMLPFLAFSLTWVTGLLSLENIISIILTDRIISVRKKTEMESQKSRK